MTEHDDSFPSLMPKPGAPLLPVQIGPRVWLFFVNDPGSFCERHGKSYLTRRRRGGEGGGGGSLTGGAVLSVFSCSNS